MRFHSRWQSSIFTTAICLICPVLIVASDEPSLSKEQMRQFLLTAKVVASRHTSEGITQPWRLTLSDGTLTHDAHFETVDEHKPSMQFAGGRTELNFVDSYKYDIAGYALAELLGLDDMVPMYVPRKWQGTSGALSWWVPVMMNEKQRTEKKVAVPDPDAWNNQMYKIRVFDELIYETDANLTNVLIGPDWKIWRIDFSRAFRQNKDLRNPKNLIRCDRNLFDKLKALNGNELAQKTKGYVDQSQVQAVMARRDKIVRYFQKLIADKGENEVLY